jgi:aminoglycoside 2'-N-acetyltransferase I
LTLAPRAVVLVEAGHVVAALDVLTKTIEHDGALLLVSGLSSVATHPEHQRCGHGRRLVRAVIEGLQASAIDLLIFTCDRDLVDFYLAAGRTATLEGRRIDLYSGEKDRLW